jgi:hypothetical protein
MIKENMMIKKKVIGEKRTIFNGLGSWLTQLKSSFLSKRKITQTWRYDF